MLLKKDAPAEINYLENWPEHYYEIEDCKKKKEVLLQAMEQNLDTTKDAYRLKLFEKRYGSDGKADGFMHAWMMIKASNAAGVSFFNKGHLTRELKQYMKELCLIDYVPENEVEQEVLTDEWNDFARLFISSCVGSKAYCSTLFGFVPIKDATVAKKIAEEIDLVTRQYPAKLSLADDFLPLREILADTYCKMIADGEAIWREISHD